MYVVLIYLVCVNTVVHNCVLTYVCAYVGILHSIINCFLSCPLPSSTLLPSSPLPSHFPPIFLPSPPLQDHMWLHRQEERDLRRTEMDIKRNQRQVERSLKKYEQGK